MADLRGKVALVTMAAGKLGRGVAEGLAEAGCTVCVADSPAAPPGALAATARAVTELGGRALPLEADFTDAAQVAGLLAALYAQEGRLDVLVNNPLAGGGAMRAVPDLLSASRGLLITVVEPGNDGEAPELLTPAGSLVTSVSVRRSAGSPRYAGRCVAALAMDPDIGDKHGGRFDIEALAREYRFSELRERTGQRATPKQA